MVTLHLTIGQPVSYEFADQGCGTYTWNNEEYTVSDDYVQTFTAANGCDSVVTLHLTINHGAELNDSRALTVAELPYVYGDTIFDLGTRSGTYTLYRTTVAGCDSIIHLTLTIDDSHNGSPFLTATLNETGDTITLRAFANSLDPETKVAYRYSLYKNGNLVNIMLDDCGGLLYVGTECYGQLRGRSIGAPQAVVPTETFFLGINHYDYFYMHFLNGRENVIAHDFTEEGTYEMVFELLRETGGSDFAAVYTQGTEQRVIGGRASTEDGVIAMTSITFTVSGSEETDDDTPDFPDGYPTLSLTRNVIETVSSIDTLTCEANTYDLSSKVAVNFTILRDGEPLPIISECVSITMETYNPATNRYYGKAIGANTGSIPGNTFRPTSANTYNFFYLDFFSQTRSRINATWRQAGDYQIAFDLVEMTGGSDLSLTYNGQKLGGKSATSTGLVLATDTIHYHISESAFAAPEMVTGVEDATVTEGRLWPNPARNTLYVQLPSDSQCETVVVTDAAGRTVCRIDRPADGGSETTLNVSGWAEGVYFLHAGTTTLKFVVAR